MTATGLEARPRFGSRHRTLGFEEAAAIAVVFITGLRAYIWLDIPISYVLAAAILPATARQLFRYRGAAVIAALSLLAAVSGFVITEVRSSAIAVSSTLQISQSARVLGIALLLASLLWARSVLGLRRMVLVFGFGALASIVLTGVNVDNPYKFTFALPVTIIALSLPWIWASRARQLGCLGVIAASAALSDARSLTAVLVIAAALTILQRRPADAAQAPRRAWTAVIRIGMVAIAAYFAVQAAILDGMLGTAARQRTEMQIDRSGNAIVGGRPEMGATIDLISARPLGYGSGALVTYDDRRLGKEGMWSLGYDPDNGYVDRYMFGNGFEVHSVLGDLWLQFGLAGALLAIVILVAVLHGIGHGLATASISALALFLGLRFAWDFALSPLPSSMVYLPLTLAVLLPLRERAQSG